jgi:glutamate 5-kinase
VGTVVILVGSKIVIKLGTKAVFDSVRCEIRRDVLKGLAEGVDELLRLGSEIIIVSSGAVGCGKAVVDKIGGIGVKQAQAAVGQIKLMEEFTKAFSWKGLHVAQFLLNVADLNSERRKNIFAAYKNLRGEAIPIVNENDVTATGELSFGDNDNLAAEILEKFDFDVLLVLTEKGALVRGGKQLEMSSSFSVDDYDNLSSNDGYGFGGLASKLEVAKRVVEMGKDFIVGKAGDDIVEILGRGGVATSFI